MKTISIIIPALNEEAHIPGLLKSIRQQTCPPLEVIVADAGSSDRTTEIALQAGCRVVSGGKPARGRNAGAKVALGDIFLFLDADVLPSSNFLASVLDEFIQRGLDVATCPVQPMVGTLTDAIFHEAANIFIRATQSFNPHAPGFCILSRRQLHESISGFDETLYLCEDHDYVRRASSHGGKFGILHMPIPVSVRRFETDGRLNVAIRYSFLAINQLIGDPFNQDVFDRYLGEYHFGHHLQTMTHQRVRHSIDFQQIDRVTFSPIYKVVDTASQQTHHFINNYMDRRKTWGNLLRGMTPPALRESGLRAKRGINAKTGKVVALIKQVQK